MADRLIPCIYVLAGGQRKREHLTARDIAILRGKLREDAFKFLKEHEDDPKCQHIVYYYDERNENGSIQEARFYFDMIPFTDEQFHESTASIKGYVGAVHRHE